MQRDLQRLSNDTFDAVVIGGGIYGASMVWEAVSRGLSVALLEKEDFGWATSANSLKIIHGGFRYLQHGDIRRMRESILERTTLMRIAPHLVHPLPVVIPVYGHGMKGREAFGIALKINDMVGYDRNRIEDPQKHIPPGKLLSREACLESIPGIDPDGLTGGIVFYDAQVYNSERLVIDYLHSAHQNGAVIANYVEAFGFIIKGGRIAGVRARDRMTGDEFVVKGRIVVNTGGPWIYEIDSKLAGNVKQEKRENQEHVIQAKAVNLVTRQLFKDYAVGLMGSNNMEDKEALIKKGSSFLFIAPWRDRSLVGTLYRPYQEPPDEFQVTEEDIRDLIEAVNLAYPRAELSRQEVSFVHAGLLPASRADLEKGKVNLKKHLQVHNHSGHGVQGLLSVEGVKYTTARLAAVKVIGRVLQQLGKETRPSISDETRLHGGEIERFDTFLESAVREKPCGFGQELVQRLVKNYGSAYSSVLKYAKKSVGGVTEDDNLQVLRAETLYAIREEMAQKLADVIFRRTETGTASHPGEVVLKLCARTMGRELGWHQDKENQELDEVSKVFNRTASTTRQRA
jgi:glycerol-3-phosphate dehydrogenase